MLRSTKLLIVLALIVSAIVATPALAVTWDVMNDFMSVGNTSGVLMNPNGDWSYGKAEWAADPYSNYTVVWSNCFSTNRGDQFSDNPPPMALNRVWTVCLTSQAESGGEFPAVQYNNAGSAMNGPNTPNNAWLWTGLDLNNIHIPVGDLFLCAGYKNPSSNSAYRDKCIVRWTAPGTGTYTIDATFLSRFAVAVMDADVHIIKNRGAERLLDGYVSQTGTSASYNSSISLNANDTIDFVVGTGTSTENYGNAVAGLRATITSADSPGTVTGAITAASGGAAIAGAKVEVVGGVRSTMTDGSGNYSLPLMPGTFTLKISKAGFVARTIPVTVTSGGSSSGNNAQLAATMFTGAVTVGVLPVSRAKVEVVGGTDYTYTGTDGVYTLAVPAGTYNLRASKSGFATQNVTGVALADGESKTQNFTTTVNAGANWPAAVLGATWNGENPNDNWSYGWAPDASPFTGYTFTAFTNKHFARTASWVNGDTAVMGAGGPNCWQNAWGNGPWIGQKPGASNKSIIRFTAPVAGWYTVNSYWSNKWGSPFDYWVVQNKTTVLQSGVLPNGSTLTPTLYTGINLPQGGVLDFCVGDNNDGATNDAGGLVATISYGVSGIIGWVKDSGGNPIAGAKVQCGVDSTFTDASGNYTLPTSATGSLTAIVTKPTYETVSQAVNITPGSLTTFNVTMSNSGVFSGRVLAKPAPGSAIAAATLETSDGVYTMTSGTDGSFSTPMTSGNYQFKVYKNGFVPEFRSITIPPAGLNQDIMMTPGWDLAGDFASVAGATGSVVTATQSGAWALAYDNGTAVVPMNNHVNGWGAAWTASWVGANTIVGYAGAWVQNPSWTTRPKEQHYRGVWEPWKVLTHPTRQFPSDGNIAYAGRKSVARFTAPVGGYFDIDVKWTARTDHDTAYTYDQDGGASTYPTVPSVDGTTSQVALKKNGVTIYSGQLNGYVGTPSSNYADSFGTAPVLTYSNVGQIEAGDVLDVVVSGDNSGWTGVDFTVSAKSAAYISGVVTSDKPGNPVIREAVVNAAGGGSPYSATTDSAGRYMLVVPAGEYEVEVSKSGHSDSGSGHATVTVGPGESSTQNFTLHFGNVWDAADDFSSVYNPNGEWSYGYSTASSNHAEFGLYEQQRGVIGGDYLNYKFWTVANGGGMWDGGVRKNPNSVMSISDNAFGAGVIPTWYSEANQLVMFPGGAASGQNYDKLAVVRWTAPKTMIADIAATWTSQWQPGFLSPDNGAHKYALHPAVLKNGVVISAPTMAGFAGKAVNGNTDSFTDMGLNPKEDFATPIAVNSGDTIDFSFQYSTLQQYLMGLDVQISEMTGNYAMVNSIAEMKAQANGTTVFLLTPVQLAVGTYHTGGGQMGCFKFQYGTAAPETSWYVQTDDRLQGLKCVVPAGGLPSLDPNCKITFTGMVDTDAFGQKIVKVGSINSYVVTDYPKTFGKTGKSLTNTGALTKVWGKIVSRTDNPDPTTFDGIHKGYAYEYITINDGSKDIKVLMHVQGEYMSNLDDWVTNLNIGDYVGVTGIASTDGTDAVIMPRTNGDILNYTDLGR